MGSIGLRELFDEVREIYDEENRPLREVIEDVRKRPIRCVADSQEATNMRANSFVENVKAPLSVGTINCFAGMRSSQVSMDAVGFETLVAGHEDPAACDMSKL